jgi:hypothetical protein
MRNSKGAPYPSKEQVETFDSLVKDAGHPESSITLLEPHMYSDGIMAVTMVNDEAYFNAEFDRSGVLCQGFLG